MLGDTRKVAMASSVAGGSGFPVIWSRVPMLVPLAMMATFQVVKEWRSSRGIWMFMFDGVTRGRLLHVVAAVVGVTTIVESSSCKEISEGLWVCCFAV